MNHTQTEIALKPQRARHIASGKTIIKKTALKPNSSQRSDRYESTPSPRAECNLNHDSLSFHTPNTETEVYSTERRSCLLAHRLPFGRVAKSESQVDATLFASFARAHPKNAV